MLAYVFPGQGAQSKGMGKGLFEQFPELTKKADEILGYSIQALCLEDPRRELNKTQFTQPALFFVNALHYYSKLNETGQKPDYVVGHSLGEFNALLAAGCFDMEVGLKLVKRRGELMSAAPKGGMAAILNSSKDDIERILQENNLKTIDIANYNTRSQIVVSGPIEDIEKAQQFFQSGEIKYLTLNTGGAFHSRYMQPIREKFREYLKEFEFYDLNVPVISNVTALPYENERIVENLTDQMSSCVLWSESIEYLLEESRKENNPITIEEVGPGNVLTKIVSRIQDEVGCSSVSSKEPTQNEAKTPSAKRSVKESANAEEKVNDWNNQYPIGTRVKSLVGEYKELETSTEAMVLFDHRAAVYMKGYTGYFDLDEIQVAGEHSL